MNATNANFLPNNCQNDALSRPDAPGGGGKVPIAPNYVLSHNADPLEIRNFEGKVFEYPEAQDGTPLHAPPSSIEEPELV